MSEIEQRHKEIKAKTTEMNAQTANLRTEISEYNDNKLPQVKKKLQDLNEQIGPSKSGYEAKGSIKKTEELQTLSKTYNACIDKRNIYEKEKTNLDGQLTKLTNDMMSWTREVEAATQRKNSAEDDFLKKKAERMSFEKKLADAKQAYDKLKASFKACHDLKKEFLEFKLQQNELITSLIERMRDLTSRMGSLGFDLSGDEVIHKVMNVLPPAFESFKHDYNREYSNRSTRISVEDFYTILLQSSKRINYMK